MRVCGTYDTQSGYCITVPSSHNIIYVFQKPEWRDGLGMDESVKQSKPQLHCVIVATGMHGIVRWAWVNMQVHCTTFNEQCMDLSWKAGFTPALHTNPAHHVLSRRWLHYKEGESRMSCLEYIYKLLLCFLLQSISPYTPSDKGSLETLGPVVVVIDVQST